MSRIVILVLTLVCVVSLLVACAQVEDASFAKEGFVELEWVQVNPPPGELGPCYAYFISQLRDMGYSGVWCK